MGWRIKSNRVAALSAGVALLGALAGCNGTDPVEADPAFDARTADALPPDAGPDAAAPDARVADRGAADARVVDAEADATTADAGADAQADAEPALDAEVDQGVVAAGWPERTCAVTVEYRASNANQVLIAGDFTGWADRPLPMQRDPDGVFRRTLTAADGLVPGVPGAYKVIADGTWHINPDANRRKYDGDCVNGAVLLPDCSRPDIEVQSVTVSPAGQGEVVLHPRRGVDGADLTTFEFTLDGQPLALGRDATIDSESGELRLPLRGLASGKHRLTVRAEDADGQTVGPFHLPLWVEPKPFDWREGVLYLAFIDRFANGDPGNDDPVGAPVEYPADWHGGDLAGAQAVLESGYFERMGVNAIWLSPINAQIDGHWPDRGDGNRRFAAYHGYWPIRAREVDPRFGGNEALHAFVQAAHARGIRVLLDLINNQVHEQHEYVGPHPDWFRSECVCGADPGCGWSERPLDCLFARYLPDINWRNTSAEARFIDDALSWVEDYDVDGFRVDAVKHVETTSVYNLRAALADRFERGGHRILMLGETAVGEFDGFDDHCGEQYPNGYAWIDAYTGPTGLDGQFDFPTHHRTQYGLLTGTAGFEVIEDAVADYEDRYRADALHVRFLGSHDTSRLSSRANFDGAVDCAWPGGGNCAQLPQNPSDPEAFKRLIRAWTVLYALPGLALLYYGDEVALPGGNDPDNRRDMPWSGALAGVSLTDAPLNEAQRALSDRVAALGRARVEWPALSRGDRAPLVVTPDLYVFARYLGDEVVVVAANRGPAVQGAIVRLGGLAGDGGDFERVVGDAGAQLITEGNVVRLDLPAGGAAIFGRR